MQKAESQEISIAVRVMTGGCIEPGVFERLYADKEPHRCHWAKNAKCGDISRRGGIILCEKHSSVGWPLVPPSWKK